jgi:hypothetical protein
MHKNKGLRLSSGRRLIGILEYWNHGFWENGMVGLANENEYNCIDFLVKAAYFLERKQKMNVCRASS